MSNKNLFKEAIADAKAVREAALANAKAALEEALTPKLQSMLAAKLNEMEYEEEGYMGEEEMEEGFTTSHGDDEGENLDFNLEENDELEEDFDLSEILAELDEEEISEPYTDEEPYEDIAGTERGYVKEAKGEEDEEESEDVADMSIEDLKDLIKDIVSQEMESEEEEMPADEKSEEEPMEMGAEESDEINLDELLAELDALGEGDDDEMEEGLGSAIKKGLRTVGSAVDTAVQGGSIKDWNACKEQMPGASNSELLACVKKRNPSAKNLATTYKPQGFDSTGGEMSEAIRTINTLRNELNEVNLLNAKLLYVNKIFKAKNLSESQKLKVIASFDKATTAKEAKVVFESLNSTLTNAAPKQAIKESYGFASRAAGVAPKKAIVETNDAITRMQKLANIIK